MERLKGCIDPIPSANDGHVCSSYLNDYEQILSCLDACDESILCLATCFRGNRGLSPLVGTAFACWSALSGPAYLDNNPSFLAACRLPESAEVSSYSTTIAGGFMAGLPKMTSCAIGSCKCKSAYLEFSDASSSVWGCAAVCMNDPVQEPFPFLPLPKGVACALDCYLDLLLP